MHPLLTTFPLAQWLQHYQRSSFISDLLAGVIVAIMLVPQGMAYAFLAGLPPQYGLYASILPLMVYALLGSSRSLAVGPVAIVSLMVGSTIGQFADQGTDAYINAAVNLSLLVGIVLLLLRALRLGSIVNFISHSVTAGFTSAAALMIAVSQIKYFSGLNIPRELHIWEVFDLLASQIHEINPVTLLVGLTSLLVLWFTKDKLCCLLESMGVPARAAQPMSKAGPMFALITGSLMVWGWQLDSSADVSTVGTIPTGLPNLFAIRIEFTLWQDLFVPALLISLIGFLESVSVGTVLASKRRERIDPNRELIALGVANLGAAISGTYPVAGGFGRSMINHSAGAQTTIASLISALLVLLSLLFLTPLFYYLPKATLGAVIVMAVIPLIDFSSFRQCWQFNKADALTLLATFVLVLALGVELGILSGIGISIALLLYRSSQPHIAVVGRVGNSEHFRNIARHDVTTYADTLALRVDESLYFANTRYVEEFVLAQCAEQKSLRHVVLIFNAVNFIDASALETLENLVLKLRDEQITLHLAEVKGPVMDQLLNTSFIEHLGDGQVFFTTDQAMRALSG
ncbi:sulfate permease [Pontibacterium granulatum]|uniref:SulP family inorganic anion transporter n=1 Tax=Pontibacterium granulatum TaxID=2036029 RepID=UPI00249C28E7|nr:sulfate permease [Pontibacterium granulatum]MDI3323029.1 sulfate permease [Pontibacterium granulatum]